MPKSEVKKIIEQERKAWIAEQGHTAEDYKALKALNQQRYSDIETLKSEIESLKQQLDTLKRELESADYYENYYKNLLDDVLEKLDERYGRAESENYKEATQEHLKNIKRDIDKKEMQERNERIKSLNDKVEKAIAEQQNRAKSAETHQESKNDDEDDNIHRNH